MRNLLFVFAIMVVVAWAISVIGYRAGGLIHLLLVSALISVLLGIIQGRRRK